MPREKGILVAIYADRQLVAILGSLQYAQARARRRVEDNVCTTVELAKCLLAAACRVVEGGGGGADHIAVYNGSRFGSLGPLGKAATKVAD